MPEPADIAAVIRALRATAPANLRFFLIGAYARDLRLLDSGSHRSIRKTLDVDFAVMVASWEAFEQFRQALLQRQEADFTSCPQPHRLIFGKRLEIDIVPFGFITAPDGTIQFPDNGQRMSVLGFDDAEAASTEMSIGEEPVRVVSVPGLVLLKLMAWHDNPDRSKDAEDLCAIFRAYADLPKNDNRLWEGPDADIVSAKDFDYVLGGIRLLGRDLARMITQPETRKAILRILARETTSPFSLARAMIPYCQKNDLDYACGLLAKLQQGFSETGT
jgi:predicted nucleotidyltransferase